MDSRTNKTLAASFLPVWPDTDPLYARASVLRSARSFPFLLDRLPKPSMLRPVVLSVRYFSSSLINGIVASLASGTFTRRIRRNGFRRADHPKSPGHIVFNRLDLSFDRAERVDEGADRF